MATQLNTAQIINEAGNHLFSSHSWAFRKRPTKSVTFTADQSYVELPFDFGDFSGNPRMQNSTTEAFQLTSMGEILLYRQSSNSPTNPTEYYGSITFPEPNVRGVVPKPRLELWPTPQDADVLVFSYRARWIPLFDNDDLAAVPEYCEALLAQYVRAFAKGYEEDYMTDIGALLESIDASQLARRAREQDGLIHGAQGFLRNGLIASGHQHMAGPFSGLGTASDPA